MVTIGIMHKYRPGADYLSQMKHSLAASDFNGKFFMYEDHHAEWGCFGNFNRALNDLVQRSKTDYVLVSSDDMIFSTNWQSVIAKKLADVPKPGYLALYTPKGMTMFHNIPKGWTKINVGWAAGSWGGQYVFHKDVAKQIMEHEFYQNHLENYKKNQQIDHCIPEVCHRLGLDQWYPNPSLCNHIGYESTLGHPHTVREHGLNFRL